MFTKHPQDIYAIRTASRDGSVFLANLTDHTNTVVEKILRSGSPITLGSMAGTPRAILATSAGELWVGTAEGLWHWDGKQFVRIKLPDAPENVFVRALVEDRKGRVLAGVQHYGLYRQESLESWQKLTQTADTGSDGIWAICRGEGDTLWLATDSGLARWQNDKWHSYSDLNSKPLKTARKVVYDDLGNLWTSSEFGVGRVAIQMLTAAADKKIDVDFDWFDRSDGLPSADCMDQQGALFKSGDGRIWVNTARGVAVVNPGEWQKRRARFKPPVVHIEDVVIDDRPQEVPAITHNPTQDRRVVAPPGSRRVEFHYVAVDLASSGKDQFRYRLKGIDEDWVDAGDRREVVYQQLPPGDYRFQVTAANKQGMWNETGDSVVLSMQPHWWQTLWFRIGAALFVIYALWMSRWAKLRQLDRERIRREEFSRRLIQSQEDERKRIAAELHDSLGQNLLIAKNQLFLVQEMSKNTEDRIQSKLKQVAEGVDAALDEARAISHQLRPFQLERLGLTKAVRAMVRQTSDSTKLPIELRIEPVDELLPAESEVMVYRLLQEALSNILKHADASRVQITLERREQQVRMMVQDDGRGFNMETVLDASSKKRGLGLSSFEERTRLLGGQFHCQSAPSQGTTLTFHIPIPETKTGDAKN